MADAVVNMEELQNREWLFIMIYMKHMPNWLERRNCFNYFEDGMGELKLKAALRFVGS